MNRSLMIDRIEITPSPCPEIWICSQMIDLMTSPHRFSNLAAIANVTPDDFDPLKWKVRYRRLWKFEHANFLLLFDEMRDEMRADKAGSAGNEYQGLPASVTTS
jgi:hypothetical protein